MRNDKDPIVIKKEDERDLDNVLTQLICTDKYVTCKHDVKEHLILAAYKQKRYAVVKALLDHQQQYPKHQALNPNVEGDGKFYSSVIFGFALGPNICDSSLVEKLLENAGGRLMTVSTVYLTHPVTDQKCSYLEYCAGMVNTNIRYLSILTQLVNYANKHKQDIIEPNFTTHSVAARTLLTDPNCINNFVKAIQDTSIETKEIIQLSLEIQRKFDNFHRKILIDFAKTVILTRAINRNTELTPEERSFLTTKTGNGFFTGSFASSYPDIYDKRDTKALVERQRRSEIAIEQMCTTPVKFFKDNKPKSTTTISVASTQLPKNTML